jgi:synaptic vesicle membrane protein VAT-1
LQRVYIEKYGGYEQLKIRHSPRRDPDHGEVQIRVHAAGVNYADCIVRMGLYQSAKELVGLPITPGFEVSGTVSAVGRDVSGIEVGDAVMAATFFGGYADWVTVSQDYVFAKPERFSFVEAAGTLATYLTAYYALFELTHPRRGDRILIHSAAGGVGMVLVQLAHTMGLTVTGVVGSSHKVPALAELKPAHIIDKSSAPLWESVRVIEPEGYDVICDANGVATLKDSYQHLRRPGKLVVYGFASMLPKSKGRPNWLKLLKDYLWTPRFNPLDLTTSSKSILAFNLSYLFDRTDVLNDAMTQFEALVSQGCLSPPRCTTYSFSSVAQAHRDIETGETTGKLVLTFEV